MSISTPIYEIETYFEQSLYFEQINTMKFYIENCCFLPEKKHTWKMENNFLDYFKTLYVPKTD